MGASYPPACVFFSCAAPQEILDVEQVMEENKGLDLTPENVDMVLDEIR